MAMNGTMNEVALEMLWMPPSTTTAVRTVSAAPVIQGSTWKLAWMAWATELACTELPGVTADSTPALVGFVAQAHALGASSITVMYGR